MCKNCCFHTHGCTWILSSCFHPLERGQLSNGMWAVLLLIKIYSWDQNTQHSLDLQTLHAHSAALRLSAVRRPQSCLPVPPSLPRPRLFATGIIWHYIISCAMVQMFFSEESLSFRTHFRKWGGLSEVFFISRPLESSFSPGISNHMWAVLYLPRCEK